MNGKESISDKIRLLREKRGLSVRQLAQLAKVDKSTVSNIETGKRSPRVDVVSDILECLGASLEIVERT